MTETQEAVAVLDLAEVRSGLMELDRRLDELSRGLVSKADADTGAAENDRGWSASTVAAVTNLTGSAAAVRV